MSTALTTIPTRPDAVLLDQVRDDLIRALPPAIVTPERFMRVALTCLRTTPKLSECLNTPKGKASLLGALMQAAALGLEPGVNQSCHLVPFFNGRGRYMECQFMVGYRGMIDLAGRNGIIINAKEVREADAFSYSLGTTPRVDHTPALKDRGAVIAAYAVAEFRDGRRIVHISDLDEIEAARAVSKSSSGSDSPWKRHFSAMAKKTAVRRLFAYLPISAEVRTAMQHDDHVLRLEEGSVYVVPDIVYDDDDATASAEYAERAWELAGECGLTITRSEFEGAIASIAGERRVVDIAPEHLAQLVAELEAASVDPGADGAVSERAEIVSGYLAQAKEARS